MFRKWFEVHWLPVVAGLAVVTTGLAFDFYWPEVVHHQHYWMTPSDLWASLRATRFVQHGALSYVYGSQSGLVTLPGLEVLLVPVNFLIDVLHLVPAVPGIYPAKPSAYYVLGPAQMLTAFVPLFGADALARALGMGRGWPRAALQLGVVVATWPVTAMWGHPEDALALGLLLYALVALITDRWVMVGWLLGAAMAMQLFAVLLVPVVVGSLGLRRGVATIARSLVLPGVLATAVLVPDFGDAWRGLVRQPNFPTVDHPTPWVLLAPKMGHDIVAAGPGRIVALAACVAAGWAVWRRPATPHRIVWWCAVALAARCLFEAVMVPYYVAPAVVLALCAAATGGPVRVALTGLVASSLVVVVHTHSGMWQWWTQMALLVVGLLGMASGVTWTQLWMLGRRRTLPAEDYTNSDGATSPLRVVSVAGR
ncbi:MAG TPA: hypothetical protein VFA11_01860 [Acidimicrobiales bacterium]|nr:hypothetical protein [Acidimicrobiales bacterium]